MTAGYPEYVAAESLWLDTIPAHWRMGRLDHVARAWPSNVDKHSVAVEPPVRLCNYTDVYKNASIVEGMNFMNATAPSEQIERFRIAIGDTLLTKDSETAEDIGVPAYVEYEAADLICGYHLSIVRPTPGAVEPRFLYWSLAARPTRGQWAVLASGVTRVGIRAGDLAKAALALPPLEEQRAIADYLDRETARIDTLIEEQERLIELLRERRDGVVTKAFLSSSDERKLKYTVAGVTVGIVVQPSLWYVDAGVPALRGVNVKRGSISLADVINISEEGHAAHPKSQLRSGDVVVVRTGQAGAAAKIPDELDGINAIDILIVRPGVDMDPDFLVWYLNSPLAAARIDHGSVGALQGHFNVGALRELPAPNASLVEQRRIAAHLDERIAKIDATIAETKRFIELSKERRAALITAAVTGHIDVREVA